jgi:hypothetical protein
MAHPNAHPQLRLDPCDPNFRQEWLSWAFDTESQMHELILAGLDAIERSNALMAQVDRVLPRRTRFSDRPLPR